MKLKYAMILCCCLALTMLSIPTGAQEAEKEAEAPVELNVGDMAPVFEGTDDAGKAWKSADHVGDDILVVYFFPAAMTGG